ncbi:MAG TPA: electron transfer flavoprotein subunit beta/FixA family protein [Candidatus Binatia bacterium]|nr:electron transfer flavoprotein subunit beta/FixA family protein [Candidatus Binatia bacterium]
MKVIVPVKQVPDVVEDLELTADGTDVDREFLKFVVNEFDEQALEEALCIKESSGAAVVVVGLDEPDVDQALYGALAKGADRAVKLVGTGEGWLPGHRRSAILAAWLAGEGYDLVLTGVQAADDLDGQLATLLGARLGLPHISVVVRVDAEGSAARVRQELAGGTVVEEAVALPAVIGVQAARQAPRYVSISRIRQAQQSGAVEEVPAATADGATGFRLRRLLAPERTSHAEMLRGGPGEVAERIVELIRAKGLIPG